MRQGSYGRQFEWMLWHMNKNELGGTVFVKEHDFAQPLGMKYCISFRVKANLGSGGMQKIRPCLLLLKCVEMPRIVHDSRAVADK